MSVSEGDVINLMNTAMTDDAMSPFLTTARLLRTTYLTGSGLSDGLLDEIEKYLAAHLASVKSPFALKEKLGEAEASYGYKGGEGLAATPYGETAMLLDSTGTLRRVMNTRIATIETIDYAQDDDD